MAEQYLFPFFADEIEEAIAENEIVENEIYTDIAWDYDSNMPVVNNGDLVIVSGLEAVKSWAFRALQTQRAKYEIFTWNHGIDIESFLGKVLTTKEKIDLTREIKDCLLQNKHITNIVNFKFVTERRKISIEFKIITKYGDIDEEVALLDEYKEI